MQNSPRKIQELYIPVAGGQTGSEPVSSVSKSMSLPPLPFLPLPVQPVFAVSVPSYLRMCWGKAILALSS